jgi:hypothetical protein
MITKYISDIPSDDSFSNMPWLCASEAMKYPTSPRATIAKPRIDGGYKDLGFGGKVLLEL